MPPSVFPAFFTALFFLWGKNTEQIHQRKGGPYLSHSPRMLIKDNKLCRSFLCCTKLAVTSAPLAPTSTWPDGVKVHTHTRTHTHLNTWLMAFPEATGEYRQH